MYSWRSIASNKRPTKGCRLILNRSPFERAVGDQDLALTHSRKDRRRVTNAERKPWAISWEAIEVIYLHRLENKSSNIPPDFSGFTVTDFCPCS